MSFLSIFMSHQTTLQEHAPDERKAHDMITNESIQIFTEVFPIQDDAVPVLHAYRLDTAKADQSIIGGKLAYRLKNDLHGHWIWSAGRIVTDNKRDAEDIMNVVKVLWSEQSNTFKDLRKAVPDPDWRPSAFTQADFVAKGLMSDLEPKILSILSRERQTLGSAMVERVSERRAWVVQQIPAVSISISSRLVYKDDLKTYAQKVAANNDLIGLWVADKTSSLKGEITEVVGPAGDEKERLLALTTRAEMQDYIQKASDDELVVRVLAGQNDYEYVTSALRIILRVEDFPRFGINSQQALKGLRIEPGLRSKLIKSVSDLVKENQLLSNAFNSNQSAKMFICTDDVGFKPRLRFGGDQVRDANEGSLLRNLSSCGLFKRSPQFQNKPIRIATITALKGDNLPVFQSQLGRQLKTLGFDSEFVGQNKLTGLSRADLEKGIHELLKTNPDLFLAFFPDDPNEDDEESRLYHNFKSLTVNQGIAGQVVYESTLDKSFAMGNIALGILSKVGNIPFVLAEPLPYADLVVGIDIARERKRRLAGSINTTAIARIYFTNGEFVRYVIHDTPLEGETIPEHVLQALFPVKDFEGKRVVIHRDGYFRGAEKQSLKDWARKIGATFHLVEVIKSGTPRVYSTRNGSPQQPPKGTAFKLSDTEAFLVSSLPPFSNATPQPLHVRTEAPFTIDKAIHSILSLTLLHYGSLRPPRLPVTIHYSDRIAYLALRGIKPKDAEGSIPFWL